MDYKELVENAKVCCGDIKVEDCAERCKNPFDKRGEEVRWCRQWLIHDLHTAITDLLSRAEAAEAREEKAEKERDAAVKLCGKLMALCSPPKEWEPKLFRPCIKRPGDYMGSGYAFLDSFNRIFDEFTETADEETYRAIREAAEQEILDRTRRMIGQKEE